MGEYCHFIAPSMYQERTYQESVASEGMVASRAAVKESDLFILAPIDVSAEALGLLCEARVTLERYIGRDGRFRTTLEPHAVLHAAPLIARRMAEAAAAVGVGPMAAVAGALAEYVGEGLGRACPEVIVENGGDIYARAARPLTVTVHAGAHSPFAGKLRFRCDPAGLPIGIATSSGTVGPSLSFGRADAVCVIAADAVEADAAATAVGNRVTALTEVEPAIEAGRGMPGVRGILIAIEDKLGVWGDLELI